MAQCNMETSLRFSALLFRLQISTVLRDSPPGKINSENKSFRTRIQKELSTDELVEKNNIHAGELVRFGRAMTGLLDK